MAGSFTLGSGGPSGLFRFFTHQGRWTRLPCWLTLLAAAGRQPARAWHQLLSLASYTLARVTPHAELARPACPPCTLRVRPPTHPLTHPAHRRRDLDPQRHQCGDLECRKAGVWRRHQIQRRRCVFFVSLHWAIGAAPLGVHAPSGELQLPASRDKICFDARKPGAGVVLLSLPILLLPSGTHRCGPLSPPPHPTLLHLTLPCTAIAAPHAAVVTLVEFGEDVLNGDFNWSGEFTPANFTPEYPWTLKGLQVG